MRIEHSRPASAITNTEPPLLKASSLNTADCSFESLRTQSKNRISFVLKALYYQILEKWNAFYNWISSLFTPEEEEDEVTFIIKEGAAPGEKNFCLVRDGKTRAVELNIGPTTADLRNVVLTKDKHLKQLFELIDDVMDKGQIGTFKVNRLVIANHLWKSGLSTDNLVKFQHRTRDPWNQVILQLLQKASRELDTLSDNGQEAFLRIQKIVVRAIIAEELEGVHREGTHALGAYYDLDACDGKNSLAQIDKLENDLGIYFNLDRLAREEDQNEYQDVLDKVCSLRNGNIKVVALPGSALEKVELPLEDLLILIDATKTEINRAVTLPPVSFSRRKI